MERVKRLPLECEPLDELLGGGIEHGVITSFYGEAGSGKSNIALLATSKALERDKKVLFVDTEGSFSVERASQIYKEFEEKSENIILIEPGDFKDQHEKINSIKDMEEDLGLIVVDSLVALYRIAMSEEDTKANRKLAQQLSELSRISRNKDIPVVTTAQVYSNFDSEGVELVSRDVARYWSKTLVRLEKVDESKRKAILTKHRSRPEGIESEFLITQEGLSKYPKEDSDLEGSEEEKIL